MTPTPTTRIGAGTLRLRNASCRPSPDDGMRILATRHRMRYTPDSAFNIWLPDLGPSAYLLNAAKAMPRGDESWGWYRPRFLMEMETVPAAREALRRVRFWLGEGEVCTLLCYCSTREIEIERRCHLILLQQILEGK